MLDLGGPFLSQASYHSANLKYVDWPQIASLSQAYFILGRYKIGLA